MANAAAELAFEEVDIATIVNEMSEEFINTVMVDGHSLSDFMAMVAFVGFKPEIVNKVIQCRAEKGGRDYKSDVVTMIAILISRGSNMSKMVKKMNSNGKRIVSTLKAAYTIQDRARVNSEIEIVTLPRVAATYPWIGLGLFKLFPSVVTPISATTMNIISPGYPKMLMSPGLISLVPADSWFDDLSDAIMLYQVKFSKLVGPRTATFESIKTQVEAVSQNARASTFLDTTTKVECLVKGGLLTQSNAGAIIVQNIKFSIPANIVAAARIYRALTDVP